MINIEGQDQGLMIDQNLQEKDINIQNLGQGQDLENVQREIGQETDTDILDLDLGTGITGNQIEIDNVPDLGQEKDFQKEVVTN